MEQKDMELYEKEAQKYGTVFDSLQWLSLFDGTVQIYGIFDKNGTLQGGFHLNCIKKYGLMIYQNPPFTPDIGPFLKMEAQNPVSVMNYWKRILSLMADFIESLPYAVVTCSLNTDIVDTQPFIWKKYKVVPGYTYLLDLNLSVEDMRKRMSSERRNDITGGQKDGLSVKQISDLGLVKAFVLKTFSRQEKEINELYLEKILFHFANNNNSIAFAAFKNEEPIACSFCVYNKNIAHYIFGGYDSENKHHGAGALCIWESIKHAKNLGLSCFDFEGSMVPQIERYFRGFGGQLTPYYRINKAKLPLEIILKFFKRELF
jgi:lipid II:glycine glycyltransferase (peptidoglycan interpeptide bridge formation enzyme)